jgi:hypothetical protein
MAYRLQAKTPKILDHVTDEADRSKLKGVMYKAQGAKKYFSSGDVKKNRARIGAAAGIYAGTMTTARLAHGGSLTENEYGERDIVGVPFL